MPGTLLCGGRTSIRTTELPCAFSCVLRPVLCDCGRAKYFRSAAETVLNLPTPSAALRRRSPTGEPLDFRPLWVCGRPRPPCALRGRLHASCRVITPNATGLSRKRVRASCAHFRAFQRGRDMSGAVTRLAPDEAGVGRLWRGRPCIVRHVTAAIYVWRNFPRTYPTDDLRLAHASCFRE